jgi:hypothetical protein
LNPSRVPARGVLGIISFFGFFVNYMLRVNVNIAIVSMTAGTTAVSNVRVLSECLPEKNASTVWDAPKQVYAYSSYALLFINV